MSDRTYRGLTAKLHNRRVSLGKAEDGSGYSVRFKRLPDDDEEERVVTTQLGLTEEAMDALVEIYLRLNGTSMYEMKTAQLRAELYPLLLANLSKLAGEFYRRGSPDLDEEE